MLQHFYFLLLDEFLWQIYIGLYYFHIAFMLIKIQNIQQQKNTHLAFLVEFVICFCVRT